MALASARNPEKSDFGPAFAAMATHEIISLAGQESWAEIHIDMQMRGTISVDGEGQSFVEADLNQTRWSQGNALGVVLARTVERSFLLEEGRMQMRMRLVELREQQIQPQIHLLVAGMVCPDKAKLQAVIAAFGARVTSQPELLDQQVRETLSQDCEQVLEQEVPAFLQACGGQPVQRGMQVLVGDKSLVTIRGHWLPGQTTQAPAPVRHSIEGNYDGRKLRSRTLFVSVPGDRIRSMEIYYDEEQFDGALRNLGDDKSAMLAMVIEETPAGKERQRFDLKALERITAPQHLQLK